MNAPRRPLSACPCCAFLETDLFLPPPQPQRSSEESATNASSAGDSGKEAPLQPQQALEKLVEHAQRLQQQEQNITDQLPLLLVDTHGHGHLERERQAEYESTDPSTTALPLVSLTCSVEPEDWNAALEFSAAAKATTITKPSPNDNGSTGSKDPSSVPLQERDTTLMGLGVHPWYLDSILQDNPNANWLQSLEELLQQHPSAVVGEIGLCKMAKCARNHPEGKTAGFDLQRQVFGDQLRLAIQYRRPVSVHCVQQHGVLLEILEELVGGTKSPQGEQNQPDMKAGVHLLPPCIAMHSFTGTANHVKSLLQLESRIKGEDDPYAARGKKWKAKQQKKKQQLEGNNENSSSNSNTNTSATTTNTPSPPIVYFGFSHYVNYAMCTSAKAQRQGLEAVRAVPLDRLLAESDLSASRDVRAGTAGAIAYLAFALNMPLEDVAQLTARNGLRFLQSHLVGTT